MPRKRPWHPAADHLNGYDQGPLPRLFAKRWIPASAGTMTA